MWPRALQRAHDARLVVGRELGEHRVLRRDRAEGGVVQPGELAAEHDVSDVEPDVAADLARHEVVVAGEDLHRDSLRGERSQRGGRGFLRGVEKPDEAGQNQLRLVGDRIRPVRRGERPICHRDDAKPVLVHIGHELARVVAPFGLELEHARLVELRAVVAHELADRQNLFGRALANELMVEVFVVDHDGHPPPREVERDFVDLAVCLVDRQLALQLGVLEDRDVEQVLESRLVEAVEIRDREDEVVLLSHDVDVSLEDDLVLRERPGLVGAEDVHRAEILDRVQPLHHGLSPRHRHGALCQVRRDDHRQHLGREPDRDGETEQQRLDPVPLAEPIEQKDDRHHHGDEADEKPTHLLHADVERRVGATTGEPLGEAPEARLSAGRDDHAGRGAAHDARAHEADRRQLGERARRCRTRRPVRLFDRQRLTRERRLAHEQVLRRDHAEVGRNHVARRQVDDVSRHQLVHRDLSPPRHGRAGRIVLVAGALDGGVRTHQRAQRQRGFVRAELLHEAQSGAEHHHRADDDHRLVVAGQAGDDRENRQQEVERIGERPRQLGVPRRRLLVRDVVAAVAQAARTDLVVGQPVAAALERGERRVGVTIRELGEPSVGQIAVRSTAVLGLGSRGVRWGARNDRGHMIRATTAGRECADVRNRSVPDSGQFRIFMARVNGRER